MQNRLALPDFPAAPFTHHTIVARHQSCYNQVVNTDVRETPEHGPPVTREGSRRVGGQSLMESLDEAFDARATGRPAARNHSNSDP